MELSGGDAVITGELAIIIPSHSVLELVAI
jgi:hypothetical protein